MDIKEIIRTPHLGNTSRLVEVFLLLIDVVEVEEEKS
jgi:hypothetical protein